MTEVWTHPSVLRFSKDADPIQTMTDHARAIVLRAMDAGWSGPPFDPLALAEFLGIPAIPTDSVRDARTVPIGASGLQIEFNPTRPRGRVRYSVAHEIAHTFFADCADQIRNRAPHSSVDKDAWQLEALCNIGAAELVMPIAALAINPNERLAVERLIQEQHRFDVSTEALFIRVARASSAPIAMFSGSRTQQGRYRVDYLIPSPTWGLRGISAGLTLPIDTHLAHCVSIGFTSAGEESWGRSDRHVHVECVGIPPYPGSVFPRVAGLMWEAGTPREAGDEHPIIRYVRGDATAPRERPSLIVQVVNDATPIWGGSGFADALRRAFPAVQRSFRTWWVSTSGKRLGRVHVADASDEISVASIVAQHGYGPSSTPRIRYEALYEGLTHVAATARGRGLSVHMPRIGAGQAGGKWPVIEDLIRDALGPGKRPVTVYDLPIPEREARDAVLGARNAIPEHDLFGQRELPADPPQDANIYPAFGNNA